MSHIGETKVMRGGMKATIIAENGTKDLTIRFANGTVREHVRLGNFNAGNVSESPVQRKQMSDYIGEKKLMNNGMMAEIIAAESYQRVTIRFANGVETISSVDRFHRGEVGFPREYHRKQHIGEVVRQSCGMDATLETYINKSDVTAVLADGTRVKHISYETFACGRIRLREEIKRTDRIGTSYPQKNGHIFTITAYESSTDVSGVFDSGETREHLQFPEIVRGNILFVPRNAWIAQYQHAQFKQECGLTVEVKEIIAYDRIRVSFIETGEELFVSKKQIDTGSCLPRGISSRTRKECDFCGFRISGTPLRVDGQIFYHATFLSDGKEYLLSAPMMAVFQKSKKKELFALESKADEERER